MTQERATQRCPSRSNLSEPPSRSLSISMPLATYHAWLSGSAPSRTKVVEAPQEIQIQNNPLLINEVKQLCLYLYQFLYGQ